MTIPVKQPITSFFSFLNSINEIPLKKGDFVRFYRGQRVDDFPTPSLFRKNIDWSKEDEMFYDVVNRKPDEFATCKCTFDHLVKMQHYNLPTRLLDITSNPLVALYFACSDEAIDGKKRTVFCFDIPKSLIKNYNSDSVTILSNLARCATLEKQEIQKKVDELKLIENLYYDFVISIEDEYSQSGHSFCDIPLSTEEGKRMILDNFYQFRVDKAYQITFDIRFYLKFLCDEHIIIGSCLKIMKFFSVYGNYEDAVKQVFLEIKNPSLLHEIKQDKPYFQDMFCRNTFETVFCVNPKLDNPRIIAQNGAFLLFSKKITSETELRNIKINKIHIDSGDASEIKNYLVTLNIKNDTMFNELDVVCKSVKEDYTIKDGKGSQLY